MAKDLKVVNDLIANKKKTALIKPEITQKWFIDLERHHQRIRKPGLDPRKS
jgi:hypothetical protein